MASESMLLSLAGEASQRSFRDTPSTLQDRNGQRHAADAGGWRCPCDGELNDPAPGVSLAIPAVFHPPWSQRKG